MNTIDKQHLLVFDMSTILYKAFYVNSRELDKDLLMKLAFNTGFGMTNKYYRTYKPHKMIFVFDRTPWRKEYTQSEDAYMKKLYKGHRRQSMTPTQIELYQMYKSFITTFEQIIQDCTSIVCLAADGLEADDLIAGICRKYGGDDTASDNRSTETTLYDNHCVTVISTDKDMLQLLRYKNVQLIDPATGNNRFVEDCGFDSVDYYLYEKAMTGDSGDNVPSAYPRYRKKKIKEAFYDPYLHTNLMNSEWTDADGRTITVGAAVNENKLLTNLTHQPEDIQQIMWDTIEDGFNNIGKYDHFKFLKVLGKYELKNISKAIDSYIPMLSLK